MHEDSYRDAYHGSTGPARLPSRHDGLAITAFILAFFLPLIGVILGWVSVASAHREGRQASGLAIAGLAIGAVISVIITVIIIAAVASTPDATQQYINCLNARINDPSLVCTPPGG